MQKGTSRRRLSPGLGTIRSSRRCRRLKPTDWQRPAIGWARTSPIVRGRFMAHSTTTDLQRRAAFEPLYDIYLRTGTTIGASSSPLAVGSACIARESTSPPCSPARSSASRKSTTAFGSSASCTMISDISTWSRKPCNPRQPVRHEVVTHVLGTLCYPCLRAGHGAYGGEGGIAARRPRKQ
jgi:hypothetical protein